LSRLALLGLPGLCALGGLAACGAPADSSADESIDQQRDAVSAPLASAYCDVSVTGVGTISMEENYLPHVIQCENGGAKLEALKAQAIAARSVAYYNMATQGKICDSQGCQVYSCGATPSAIHYQAVKETAGIYLSYDKTLTYGFYVAGDSGVSAPSCVGNSGATEHWVTYNAGKAGNAVEQTALGYVGPPGFGQNRGCMSQWGARCLENSLGYDYQGILQFFYGADIQLLQATGSCIEPPVPPLPALDARFVGQGSSAEADTSGDAFYQVCAGDAVDLWFEFEDSGTAGWSDGAGSGVGESVRLGVPGDTVDPLVGSSRVSLNLSSNAQVSPSGGACNDPGCARTRFDLTGTAPSEPGVYVSRWQLVDEGRGWFGPEVWLSFRTVECAGGAGGAGAGGAGAGGSGAGGASAGGTSAWGGSAGGGAAGAGGAGATSGGPATRVVTESESCSLASGASGRPGTGGWLWLGAMGLLWVARRRLPRAAR